ALAKLSGKRSECGLVHAERSQTPPGECDRDPALLPVHRLAHGLGRMHPVQDVGKPVAAAAAIAEREELIAPRECGGSGQQDVLDVVRLEHESWLDAVTASGPACPRAQPSPAGPS